MQEVVLGNWPPTHPPPPLQKNYGPSPRLPFVILQNTLSIWLQQLATFHFYPWVKIGDMTETSVADWPNVNLLYGFGFTTRSYVTKVFKWAWGITRNCSQALQSQNQSRLALARFPASSDWFTVLFAFLVIDHWNFVSFSFETLKWDLLWYRSTHLRGQDPWTSPLRLVPCD